MARKKVQQERRTQILEALNECLLRKSFMQTSIKDIAAVAGVNHGVLHYYFKSKEDILLNYIDYVIEQYKLMFAEWSESIRLEESDAHELIRDVFQLISTKITLNKNLSKIFIEIWEISLYNKKVKVKVRQAYQEWERITTRIIARATGDETSARNLSMAMIAFFEGISLFSIIFDNKEYPIENILSDFQKRAMDVIK
jgi:AcrR family transcriptional regulator